MSERTPSIVPPADAQIGGSDAILEIIGHLGAALIQTVPADDPIIIDHIRSAHRLALDLHRDSSPAMYLERINHGTSR